MRDVFVIEVEDLTAGILLREAQGYRFFAAAEPFDAIEAQPFPHPRDAERAASRLLAQRRAAVSVEEPDHARAA